jgi:hypothetical protein
VDGSNETHGDPLAAPTAKSWSFGGTPPVRRPVSDAPRHEAPKRGDPPDDVVGAMSPATAMQLLAVGPQDTYLSLNPETTFFQAGYKRHSTFATECFEERFSGAFELGRTNTCVLGKHGDFLGDVTLRVVLPSMGAPGTWVDSVGYALINRVRFRVGDVVVHDQERLWYDIDDKLSCPEGHAGGLERMLGRGGLSTAEAHEVLVPLKFFFSHKRPSQFFPVGALRDDVVLEIVTEPLGGLTTCTPTGAWPGPLATVLVDNMYVDLPERPRYTPRDIMFEVVQDVDALSYKVTNVGASTNEQSVLVTVDMRAINMPVRYLAVVAYRETPSVQFEYLDAIESASVYVGSDELFGPRAGGYFDLVQTYDRAVRCEASNVGLFSFALRTDAWQPCGSLNFTALRAPVFKVRLKPTTVPLKVKVFAVGVNWLDFAAGKCSMRYDG